MGPSDSDTQNGCGYGSVQGHGDSTVEVVLGDHGRVHGDRHQHTHHWLGPGVDKKTQQIKDSTTTTTEKMSTLFI